jgi:hypothetical protein
VYVQNVPDHEVEHSEGMLYHVRVLEELGEISESLNLLESSADSEAIIDRTSIMEIRGAHRLRALVRRPI